MARPTELGISDSVESLTAGEHVLLLLFLRFIYKFISNKNNLIDSMKERSGRAGRGAGGGGDLRHQEDTRAKKMMMMMMMLMLTFGQLLLLPLLLPTPLTAYEIFTVCLPASAMRYATIFYAVSATSCCKLKMQSRGGGL